MFRCSFDIGGVLSKYPNEFKSLINTLQRGLNVEIHVITDMHDRASTLELLRLNKLGWIPPERVHNADYAKYGEMCKAVIIKKIGIDMIIDDFLGYLTWDQRLGPAPIRLHVQPDPCRPYWSKDWVTNPDDGEFGRRVCPPFEELIKEFETERGNNG